MDNSLISKPSHSLEDEYRFMGILDDIDNT